MIRSVAASAFIESGITEYELARRNAEAASQFLPRMAPLLQNILRLHLRDLVRNQVLTQEELAAGAARNTTYVYVGFADIVGFTRLGERVELGELGALGARLTELALAHTKPPTRLVKTIGDAVMFVSPSADSLLDTMLDLVERGEQDDDEFPQLRAGAAAGLAVSREGDWYGPPVNLASRVTGIARPGSVLATKEVRDAAADGYSWSTAGAHDLKGLKRRVPLYRARRRGLAGLSGSLDAPHTIDFGGRRRPHPHLGCARAQPQGHHPRAAARRPDRHHRALRVREVEPCLRHDLCRGPAPLRRVAVGLRPPVPGPDGQARRRLDRGALAGDLDRPEDDLAEPALHGRDGHGDLRLPAPAVGPDRPPALPQLRGADRRPVGRADRRPRDDARRGHALHGARAGRARPQGRVQGPARGAARRGLHAREDRRRAAAARGRDRARQEVQARHRGGRRPPRR